MMSHNTGHTDNFWDAVLNNANTGISSSNLAGTSVFVYVEAAI